MIKIYLEGKVQNYTVFCFPIDYNTTAIKDLDFQNVIKNRADKNSLVIKFEWLKATQ